MITSIRLQIRSSQVFRPILNSNTDNKQGPGQKVESGWILFSGASLIGQCSWQDSVVFSVIRTPL